MEESGPKRSLLYPGQSLHLHALRGMTVMVLRGEIQLGTPPLCIGEHNIRNTVLLHEGQAHASESAGWMTIHARTATELAWVASPKKTRAWRNALRTAWFGTWRRRRAWNCIRRGWWILRLRPLCKWLRAGRD